MIKGSVYQEAMTVINIHASSNRYQKYIKQKLTNEGKSSSTIIIGDFSIFKNEQLDRRPIKKLMT